MENKEILRGKTVVIADDEPLIRELIKIELEELGVICLEASDGNEAYQKIKDNEVDILISDLRMPGCGGEDLLRNLKENNLFIGKPIFIFTGFHTDLTKEKAQALGALEVFHKPFIMSEIIPTLINSIS